MSDAVEIIEGDCLDVLPTLEAGSIDAVVTDPPYALTGASRNGSPRTNDSGTPFGRHNLQPKGFMGHQWDGALPTIDHWRAVFRALKPGGYLATFGGTRTYHRLTCAVEDAGLEIRDCLMWLYGTGFPKGKGCLKPAYEPVVLARKPGPRVLPLGVDECRVPTSDDTGMSRNTALGRMNDDAWEPRRQESESHPAGRYPPNVLHDGSDEVTGAFAAFGGLRARGNVSSEIQGSTAGQNVYGTFARRAVPPNPGDAGTAARFFYCAKAGKGERVGDHPTVKPAALMQWLVRLVCPPGGLALDPFLGSGTTAVACLREGRRCVGIEKQPEYVEIARRRVADELAKYPLLEARP